MRHGDLLTPSLIEDIVYAECELALVACDACSVMDNRLTLVVSCERGKREYECVLPPGITQSTFRQMIHNTVIDWT